MHFWSLVSNMKITGMTISWFLSWLFTENVFFFSFYEIHGNIPILTGVQKRYNSGQKGGHNLLRNGLLRSNFQHEGHLYTNCLICIQTIYCEFLHFQFFSRKHGYANSHPHSRSKCTHKSPKKTVIFCEEILFLKLFLRDEVYSDYLLWILYFSVPESWHTCAHLHHNVDSKRAY